MDLFFQKGYKKPGGPYTTEDILFNGEAVLSNVEDSLKINKGEPPYMNRAARRRADKGGVWCTKCGINWLKRFDEWSKCTVGAPPALIATGHDFNI